MKKTKIKKMIEKDKEDVENYFNAKGEIIYEELEL